MNYVILKSFLSVKDCNSLIALIEVKFSSELLPYDNAFSNVWIDSTQSKGLRYRWQNDFTSLSMTKGIIRELEDITGIEFENNLRNTCLSINHYGHRAEANPHRDRDKSLDGTYLVRIQEYLVVGLLTRPGVDTVMSVDELFINFNPKSVSNSGRAVSEHEILGVHESIIVKDRFYPNLKQGDLIIFKNDISIHGVDSVMVKEGQRGRMTIEFRSK